MRKKELRVFLLLLIVMFMLSCKETEKASKEDHSLSKQEEAKDDSRDFLSAINNEVLNKAKQGNNPKKESIETDNGDWALLVEERKILKEDFEAAYQDFIKEYSRENRDKKISKLDFVFIFLQNYFLLPKARTSFKRNNKSFMDFVNKQVLTSYYINEQLYRDGKKSFANVSDSELSKFYLAISKKQEYRKLKLRKDKDKIIKLFKISKINQRYIQFENKLIGEYSIVANDEWESGIIEKYKKGDFDRKKALDKKEYKKYWLYKIFYDKKRKIKFLYIRDIEREVFLSKRFGTSFIKKAKVNEKDKLLRQFLIKELVYLNMEEKGLIFSYKEKTASLRDKFIMEYYLGVVLKLYSKEKRRKYIENYINSKKVKLNKLYFN